MVLLLQLAGIHWHGCPRDIHLFLCFSYFDTLCSFNVSSMRDCFCTEICFAFSLFMSPRRFRLFFAFLKLIIWHCTHIITPSSLARTPYLIIFLQELWLVCPAEKNEKGTGFAIVLFLLALEKASAGTRVAPFHVISGCVAMLHVNCSHLVYQPLPILLCIMFFACLPASLCSEYVTWF